MVLLSLAKALQRTDMKLQYGMTEEQQRSRFPYQDMNMRLGTWVMKLDRDYWPPGELAQKNFTREMVATHFQKVYEEWYEITNAYICWHDFRSQGCEYIMIWAYFNYKPIIKPHYTELMESFIENNLQ